MIMLKRILNKLLKVESPTEWHKRNIEVPIRNCLEDLTLNDQVLDRKPTLPHMRNRL